MTQEAGWPELLPVGAVGFARRTSDLAGAVHFYRDLLGLPLLVEFGADDGPDSFAGVVFGMPGAAVTFELTVPEPLRCVSRHHLRRERGRSMLRPMYVARLPLLLALVAGAALGACDSGASGSGAGGCAATIEFAGRDYFGHSANVGPADLGRKLGEARVPACNDTNGADEDDGTIVAVEISGVSPDVAVAVSDVDGAIFIRKDSDFVSLPADVLRLLQGSVASPSTSPTSG